VGAVAPLLALILAISYVRMIGAKMRLAPAD
jgi:hypothetical protein